jgi:type II secretory pathway pseudopilin PulG
MKATTFQTLIVGLLCLAVAGLSGGLYHQHQRLSTLQSTNDQYRQTLDTLQQDSSTFKDAQQHWQPAFNDLKQRVDAAAQQANPPLQQDQWAHAIQALRDELSTHATATDVTVLSTRLTHIEQQLLDLKHTPSAPTPATTKPKKTARSKPTPLLPPFSVLGIERRGGERFLAVAPVASHTLADVRLLRSGEPFGDWRLKSVETHSAIFAVAARPDQTLLLP